VAATTDNSIDLALRAPRGSYIVNKPATDMFPFLKDLASKYPIPKKDLAGGVDVTLTEGETIVPQEMVNDVGLGNLEFFNNKPKEGGHQSIDNIIAFETLQNIKPMSHGGEVQLDNYMGGGQLMNYQNGGMMAPDATSADMMNMLYQQSLPQAFDHGSLQDQDRIDRQNQEIMDMVTGSAGAVGAIAKNFGKGLDIEKIKRMLKRLPKKDTKEPKKLWRTQKEREALASKDAYEDLMTHELAEKMGTVTKGVSSLIGSGTIPKQKLKDFMWSKKSTMFRDLMPWKKDSKKFNDLADKMIKEAETAYKKYYPKKYQFGGMIGYQDGGYDVQSLVESLVPTSVMDDPAPEHSHMRGYDPQLARENEELRPRGDLAFIHGGVSRPMKLRDGSYHKPPGLRRLGQEVSPYEESSGDLEKTGLIKKLLGMQQGGPLPNGSAAKEQPNPFVPFDQRPNQAAASGRWGEPGAYMKSLEGAMDSLDMEDSMMTHKKAQNFLNKLRIKGMLQGEPIESRRSDGYLHDGLGLGGNPQGGQAPSMRDISEYFNSQLMQGRDSSAIHQGSQHEAQPPFMYPPRY